MKNYPYDFFGNVVVVKFPFGIKQTEKKKFAESLMRRQKSVKTVLEKIGKFKGRLRKQETKYVAGEKTKEILYKENNCVFRLNIDKTYFSPRLSNDRKEIAKQVKKGEEVLVMFAGVAPYSIVIAKNSQARKVYSNEINREANKYAEMNIELNKLKNRVVLVPGDIKMVVRRLSRHRSQPPTQRNVELLRTDLKNRAQREKLSETPEKFDVIVMPRPQLKESFLREAFMLSKKGTRIFYHDFISVSEKNLVLEKIKNEARKAKKKIKILRIKNAGEIAPYKLRVRIDIRVL
ncbi:MAG: hypothetical protein ABIH49_02705 [archaeon]